MRPPTGFVIHFTNGLKVYLSGDTGLHTEMKTVVRDFHQVNLSLSGKTMEFDGSAKCVAGCN